MPFKKRRKTGPKSWKSDRRPQREVNIDFDAASKAWLANKVKLGGGEYRYKKTRPTRKRRS